MMLTKSAFFVGVFASFNMLCDGFFFFPSLPSGKPCSSSPCQNGGKCNSFIFLFIKTYYCVCAEGFTGKNCETKEETCTFFVGDNRGTNSYEISGDGTTSLKSVYDVYRAAYDGNGKIVYTDGSNAEIKLLSTSDYTSTDVTTITTSSSIFGIAADAQIQRIFAYSFYEGIKSYKYDGSDEKDIITTDDGEFFAVYGMVADSENSILYWSDVLVYSISSINYGDINSPSDYKVHLSKLDDSPTGLVLDGDILYFTMSNGEIRQLDLSDDSTKSLISAPSGSKDAQVYSLVLCGDYFYYPYREDGLVYKISKGASSGDDRSAFAKVGEDAFALVKIC